MIRPFGRIRDPRATESFRVRPAKISRDRGIPHPDIPVKQPRWLGYPAMSAFEAISNKLEQQWNFSKIHAIAARFTIR
jgi:hypothetical protein